jgi:hypothetical protein
MTDPDPIEQARVEQHIALLSEAEFADLVTRTRAPVTATEKDLQTVDNLADSELRTMLRRLLGQPDPEPKRNQPNPREGRTTGAPGISPDQYRRDFLRRLTGTQAAYAEQLPEDN